MWNVFFFSCVLRAESYTLHSHHTSPLKISLILILLKEIFLHHFLYWKHISWQIKNTESFCSSYIYSLHLTNMLQAFSCMQEQGKPLQRKSTQVCVGLKQSNSSPLCCSEKEKNINTHLQTTLHLHTPQLLPNGMYCLYTKSKSASKDQHFCNHLWFLLIPLSCF